MEFGTSRGSYQYSSDSPKNANEISIGATASKVCNIHSDEMSRVGHILSYPGAASLVTKMLFLSLSSEACPISKVHRFGMSSRKRSEERRVGKECCHLRVSYLKMMFHQEVLSVT